MMKKYLPYILILIISVSIFLFRNDVFAQKGTEQTYGTPCQYDVKGNVTNRPCDEFDSTSQTPIDTIPIQPDVKGSEQNNPAAPSGIPLKQKEDTSYHLLEPLPCEPSTAGCELNKETGRYELASFNPSGQGKLGQYLNFAIKLFIGLCAVAAVVMIVIGGIEYSSELISTKAAAKERILGAIFGLILALFSWLILYTINPDLLNTDVDIGEVGLVSEGEVLIEKLKEFTLSGKQTIDGKPGAKIDFKKIACPSALAAERTTGVKAAYLLAIYAQESGSGALAYSGCSSNSVTFRPKTNDKAHLDRILAAIGKTAPVKVSCSGTAAGKYGGCMGHMQVCPSEWERMGGLGKSPWDLNDSMVMAATLLVREKGYNQNPNQAVCNYFGGCSYSTTNYQQSVLGKAAAFQARINKGDCNP